MAKKRSLAEFRQKLPIFAERDNILKAIKDNSVLIVVGETGSGKTTQLPQYLREAGYASNGSVIACTQPRRVAALSLARRVAEECGTALGDAVGYTIRFDDKTSPNTRIKYMTDGMMLREVLMDALLTRYSVIILDEAHERTLRTDILFGMVKAILKQRPELKILVMSATLNVERFSAYFDGAPVLHFKGRQFPVEVLCTVTPQSDYIDAALVTIFQTHIEQPLGDILVFLTGQEEIESLEKLLNEYSPHCPPNSPKLIVCPLFANLPTHQQALIFSPTPTGCRKVVLATNIAETSITIPGVKYVVDTGLHKVRGYDARTGMETLCIQPISKASARQRAGRAGRESAGVCYRLYTEETFRQLSEEDTPEIQRCHLASVVLLLKASNVDNIFHFDFMDKPTRDTLIKSLEELLCLEALDRSQRLTDIGREMADFPVDPPYSRTLIKSKEMGCVKETIDIISLLSVESIFYAPNDKRDEAFEVKKKFISYDGDLITLMNVLEAFLAVDKDKKWCTDHFINYRALCHVLDVKKQLTETCTRRNYFIEATGKHYTASLNERILETFLKGFFYNLATRQADGSYKTMFGNQAVHIHPASVLFNKKAELVMYCDVVWTSKRYMRSVSRVDPSWLGSISKPK